MKRYREQTEKEYREGGKLYDAGDAEEREEATTDQGMSSRSASEIRDVGEYAR